MGSQLQEEAAESKSNFGALGEPYNFPRPDPVITQAPEIRQLTGPHVKAASSEAQSGRWPTHGHPAVANLETVHVLEVCGGGFLSNDFIPLPSKPGGLSFLLDKSNH